MMAREHMMIERLEDRTMLSAAVPHPAPMAAANARAVLVKDINPGPADSMHLPWDPGPESEMVTLGNQVFFDADDGTHGLALWKSDGTAAGTRMVRQRLGDIADLTSMGGMIYFVRNGRELWQSDGTTQGTAKVKTFAGPGVSIIRMRDGDALNSAVFDGRLLLSSGRRLWTFDGKRAQILKQFESYAPDRVTIAGGRIFFIADRKDHRLRSQLWVSDGTPEGTTFVAPVRRYTSIAGVVGHSVLLSVPRRYSNATWISDGTPAGTHPSPWTLSQHGTVYLNHKIYFIEQDRAARHYLWAADESLTTRTLVKAFPKGDDVFDMRLVYNDEVYFTMDDGEHGVELMKTDGTADGTVLVKNIRRGGLGSYPNWFTILNGKLLFTADDAAHGAGVWSTDGTTQGTQLARPLVGRGEYLDVNDFYNSGSAIYITTVNGTVWKSDGTHDGTTTLGDFDGGRLSPGWFNAANGHVFFIALEKKHGTELWMSP